MGIIFLFVPICFVPLSIISCLSPKSNHLCPIKNSPETQELKCCPDYFAKNDFCEPCKSGFFGKNCTEKCLENSYGVKCNKTCQCGANEECHNEHGCICKDGYRGENCNETCPEGRFGENCTGTCSCQKGFTCDHITGNCSRLCEDDKPSHKQKECTTVGNDEKEGTGGGGGGGGEENILKLYSIPITILAIILTGAMFVWLCHDKVNCRGEKKDESHESEITQPVGHQSEAVENTLYLSINETAWHSNGPGIGVDENQSNTEHVTYPGDSDIESMRTRSRDCPKDSTRRQKTIADETMNLNYAEVVFEPKVQGQRFYIHGTDNKTPYAEIDFSAKAEPLVDDSDSASEDISENDQQEIQSDKGEEK